MRVVVAGLLLMNYLLRPCPSRLFGMRQLASGAERLIVLALFLCVATCLLAKEPSDEQVKQLLIRQSQATYSGNCPCPYNTMRNGRACGGRSAYSRPGGQSPLCYPGDVTPEMIKQWRKQNSS